jgi:DNA-binding CsgD family transcriptional regulator
MAMRVADYRGALDLIGEAQRTTDVDEFRAVVTSRLRTLLDTEMVIAADVNDGMAIVSYADNPPGRLSPGALAGFHEFAFQHPLVRAQMLDGLAEATRLSDLISQRNWLRLDVYQECQRHVGGRHEISIKIAQPGHHTCIAAQRPTRDFTEREIELLETLRPHLGWGYETIRKRTEGPQVSAEVLADRLPISSREAEVLACVARGYTNAEVAQELMISRHTVNKHLERIYDKLRVPNRTTAATVAHEAVNGVAGFGMRP